MTSTTAQLNSSELRHDRTSPIVAIPPLFKHDAATFLVRRTRECATTDIEKQTFMSILRHAYEDALELEVLYRELPGVLSDDHLSTENFHYILKHSSARPTRISSQRQRSSPQQHLFMSIADFGKFTIGPCEPRFLISPASLVLIRYGIDRVTRGDQISYERYIDTVRSLWSQCAPLQRMYGMALRGVGEDGRDMLVEEMAILARNTHAAPGQRPPNIENSRVLGHPSEPPYRDVWPPPISEVPLDWPPSRELDSEIPWDFCQILEELCVGMALDQPRSVISTNANGITEIQPAAACAGDTITIHGSGFGPSQPSHISVVIGSIPLPVASWSDTEIEVTIPPEIRSGCIGFRDELIEAQARHFQRINERVVRDINTGLRCLGTGEELPLIPFTSSGAPCTGFNFLHEPLPYIASFFINSGSQITVEPGEVLILRWQVSNATSIRIRRTSTVGPQIDVIDPPGNLLNLGVFTDTRPVDATYELIATNNCGTRSRTVTCSLRKNPALGIVGVEVVQTIQKFNLADRTQNNSVELVANKRTMARVYIDSGLTTGFDYGAGPDRIPNVTGEVTIFPAGIDSGAPLNPGGAVTARSLAQIDRSATVGDMPRDTLNFELPVDHLSGSLNLYVSVRALNPQTQIGWSASSTQTVHFQPKQARTVVRILIRDDVNPAPNPPISNPPTAAEYSTSLQGARARYPIAEDGFVVKIAPGFQVVGTAHDLTTALANGNADFTPWQELLDDIADIADDFDEEASWTGLLPNDGRYKLNGLGYSEGTQAFIARATLPATFAHEMGHNFRFSHANCGRLGPNETPDPRLPTATEDMGINMGIRAVVPQGQTELMCAGGPQSRWPSIAFYSIVFNALA